ncbi:LON peptidase N-terminal domain and RING finger protein 3 [Armadillidium nasatum]|uniref:LON peptidase N-terminal domain and RING finger protein 3 n=1 Tax=Armadillidium nasatum TaxID=96803 RepID=A0A5N5SN19_9CRUS|nr:LON peptidase N-terminal domain and RING finger protein 3 [Armadillidium nasatum]
MRARLTENGVPTLYSSTPQLQVKVQVLYLSHWNTMSFLRVTDSKHLSPVMAIMKMNEKFVVGDIILIKKIQLQPSTYFRDDEIQPLIDTDLNHIIIIEYQVVEKKDKVCLLFNLPSDKPGDSSYWHSLYLIKNCLVKGDIGDLFFKEGEKRIQLLRPDCNMLRERGNELFKQRNYNKAILHYDMAKQKDNYDARVWNNSSQAFFSNEEFSKAKRDALVALKLDPFSKKAYYRASKAMVKAGDINGALEVTEAGLYICGQCEELESQLNTIKEKID